MIGGLQRDNVSEFVPERTAPVEASFGACARRVHHHTAAEADAQRSKAGYSHRADSKVFMVGKHFKVDRLSRRELVLLRKRFECLLKELGYIVCQ